MIRQELKKEERNVIRVIKSLDGCLSLDNIYIFGLRKEKKKKEERRQGPPPIFKLKFPHEFECLESANVSIAR